MFVVSNTQVHDQESISHNRFESGFEEKLRCMFCGGATCKRCGDDAYLQQENPALNGIHSTWIIDTILAMQRPNDFMIQNIKMVDQFKSNTITSIFNLTEAGEHPYCGRGNLPQSGFPYSPEHLMEAGIKHFNFSWADMTVPSLTMMRDIVNIAVNEIRGGGKIAVHCHAGYGRTGMVIACIIVALCRTSAVDAIELVRNKRPGSVQTSKQWKFVVDFEAYYAGILNVFGESSKEVSETSLIDYTAGKTFAQSVRDQWYVLDQTDIIRSRGLRWMHKIVFESVTGLKSVSTSSVDNLIWRATFDTKISEEVEKLKSKIDANDWTWLDSVGSAGTAGNRSAEEKSASCTFPHVSGSQSLSPRPDTKEPASRPVSEVVISSSSVSEKKTDGNETGINVANLTAASASASVQDESNSSRNQDSKAAGVMCVVIDHTATAAPQTSTTPASGSGTANTTIATQLLLDWLESRSDAIFDVDLVSDLKDLWKRHLQTYSFVQRDRPPCVARDLSKVDSGMRDMIRDRATSQVSSSAQLQSMMPSDNAQSSQGMMTSSRNLSVDVDVHERDASLPQQGRPLASLKPAMSPVMTKGEQSQLEIVAASGTSTRSRAEAEAEAEAVSTPAAGAISETPEVEVEVERAADVALPESQLFRDILHKVEAKVDRYKLHILHEIVLFLRRYESAIGDASLNIVGSLEVSPQALNCMFNLVALRFAVAGRRSPSQAHAVAGPGFVSLRSVLPAVADAFGPGTNPSAATGLADLETRSRQLLAAERRVRMKLCPSSPPPFYEAVPLAAAAESGTVVPPALVAPRKERSLLSVSLSASWSAGLFVSSPLSSSSPISTSKKKVMLESNKGITSSSKFDSSQISSADPSSGGGGAVDSTGSNADGSSESVAGIATRSSKFAKTPDSRQALEFMSRNVEEVFVALHTLLLLVKMGWTYTGPSANRLRTVSSSSILNVERDPKLSSGQKETES